MNLMYLILFLVSLVYGQKNPNYATNRTTMVHLFEWKFADIANECETFLGPMGYGGVQTSPIQENVVIPNRPWFERYQPISYKIKTRSTNVGEFKNMVERCNNVGVRIYVDLVLNHITGNHKPATGTGGSNAFPEKLEYPAVPFGPTDFHPQCIINNYNNADEVRNCELLGLHDLNQSKENVRNMQIDFINEIIDYDIAGIRGQDDLRKLYNWGESWGLIPSDDALVMIDNHDNQRGHGVGGNSILTYKNSKQYKMAVAFMLAHPYGHPRVMSSYHFDDPSQGPPADAQGNIITPIIKDNICTNGWVCEHRWRQIYNMVQFRNVVGQSELKNWWSGDKNQIAFGRGDRGFIAFNTSPNDLKQKIKTGLPAGQYCDVISGMLENGKCTGKVVHVDSNSIAHIDIPVWIEDCVLAIHVQSKLGYPKH